jgi:hypothetical protein
MQARLGRLGAFVVAGLAFAAAPALSEASFSRTYSGRLSSNGSISTQQLTADPANIAQGSMSTLYEPGKVSLEEIIPGPEFDITALIGVRLPTDSPTTERFVTYDAYIAGSPLAYAETGYLQVTFVRKEGSTAESTINDREGFVVVDTDGPLGGDDTHAMFFRSVVLDDPNLTPTYTLYNEDGTMHDVLPDYLRQINGETSFDIQDAVLSGPVPEPGTGAIVLALAGAAAMRRGRRSR